MILKEARQLAREIEKTGRACWVPLGYGPDGYFARIFGREGPIEFRGHRDWEDWETQHPRLPPPRSVLESLIDKACGLA